MKEEIIIRILDKAYAFMQPDQVRQLRGILDEALYHIALSQECTALAIMDNLPDRITLFLATKKLEGNSPKTIKNYSLILNKFAQFMRLDVEQISDMDIRVYLAAYEKTGVKNSTIATTISCFKSFFAWLETQDYINKSPMRKIKNIKIEKRFRKALSQEELEMLRMACKTAREKAIVEFFYSTGCRLDEVYKLNKGDINWNTDSCLVIGKGNKERRVFLNAKAKVHLWKYLDSRRDRCEALFVTGRGVTKRLGGRSFEEIFKDLGNKAGITKHVHPHLLRHTMATSMLNSGASLASVQGLLGHDDPATTQIYAQLNSEELHMTHKRHSA